MLREVTINSQNLQKRVGRDRIEFGDHINIIAGPNGSGKTSLLDFINNQHRKFDPTLGSLMKDHAEIIYYSAATATADTGNAQGQAGALNASSISHGQAMLRYLERLNTIEDPCTVILDEPELALSLQAVEDLAKTMIRKRNVQFIISTHHPLLWTIPDAEIITLGDDTGFVARTTRTLYNRLKKLLERHERVEPAKAVKPVSEGKQRANVKDPKAGAKPTKAPPAGKKSGKKA